MKNDKENCTCLEVFGEDPTCPLHGGPLRLAVYETFGGRCEVFDPECETCQAWAEIDRVAALSSPAPEAAKGNVGIIGHVDHGKTSLAAAAALLSKQPTPDAAEEMEVKPSQLAWEIALAMEAKLALSTTTRAKAVAIQEILNECEPDKAVIEKLKRGLEERLIVERVLRRRAEAAEASLAEAVRLLVRLGTWIEDEANAELPFITEAEDDAYRTFLQSLGKESIDDKA